MPHHSVSGFPIDSLAVQLVLAIPFIVGFSLYLIAVSVTNKRYRDWPPVRFVLFLAGIALAILSVAGPIAVRAHEDFVAHMVGHLLLGMLAPLLIALAMPVTLILRTLPVVYARKLMKIVKSWPVRILTNPFFVGFLNIGGLWLLYTTSLFSMMHESVLLYVFVHFHLFIAGYLFTISIVYIEPFAHQYSFYTRAIALLLALAGHGILAKLLYANPPSGVSSTEAETGAMVMYYGGDLIDVVLIVLLCWEWYKKERPRREVVLHA